MNHNAIPYLKFSLRRDMDRKDLAPKEALIINNLRHIYNVIFNGKLCEASYVACLDSFGRKGLVLICSYGLLGSRLQFDFSKSTEEVDTEH